MLGLQSARFRAPQVPECSEPLALKSFTETHHDSPLLRLARTAAADLRPDRRRKNLARLCVGAKGMPARPQCVVRSAATTPGATAHCPRRADPQTTTHGARQGRRLGPRRLGAAAVGVLRPRGTVAEGDEITGRFAIKGAPGSENIRQSAHDA